MIFLKRQIRRVPGSNSLLTGKLAGNFFIFYNEAQPEAT